MLPVAIALIGTRVRREPVLFVGWFGPRGLASIAFGLTAIVTLEEAGVDSEVLRQTITWTVLLSVVLHGLSAGFLADRFGRDTVVAGGIEEDEAGDVAVSARSRWAIGVAPPGPLPPADP